LKHLKVANLQIVIILITKAALSLKVWRMVKLIKVDTITS